MFSIPERVCQLLRSEGENVSLIWKETFFSPPLPGRARPVAVRAHPGSSPMRGSVFRGCSWRCEGGEPHRAYTCTTWLMDFLYHLPVFPLLASFLSSSSLCLLHSAIIKEIKSSEDSPLLLCCNFMLPPDVMVY